MDHTNFEEFVDTARVVSNFTEAIQREISESLVKDKNIRHTLSVQLSKSEEEMQKIMNNAVMQFVAAMPLATMNRSNLFTQALAVHSNITMDKTVHDAFVILNNEALTEELG